jgi:uncharacterized membrane protein
MAQEQPREQGSDDAAGGGLPGPEMDEATRNLVLAASVFESELRQGVPEARTVEARLNTTKRIDPAEFEKLVVRARRSAHTLINMIDQQVIAGATGGSADLARKLTTDAHDAVDVLLNLSRLTPVLAERTLIREAQEPPSSTQNT